MQPLRARLVAVTPTSTGRPQTPRESGLPRRAGRPWAWSPGAKQGGLIGFGVGAEVGYLVPLVGPDGRQGGLEFAGGPLAAVECGYPPHQARISSEILSLGGVKSGEGPGYERS